MAVLSVSFLRAATRGNPQLSEVRSNSSPRIAYQFENKKVD
jgi:hypothetical protein